MADWITTSDASHLKFTKLQGLNNAENINKCENMLSIDQILWNYIKHKYTFLHFPMSTDSRWRNNINVGEILKLNMNLATVYKIEE